MFEELDASIHFSYTDPRFAIDVLTSASHRAPRKNAEPDEFGDFNAKQDKYHRILTAARTICKEGSPCSLTFSVFGFTADQTLYTLYAANVGYTPEKAGSELEFSIDGYWVPEALALELPASGEVAEQALNLAFGGLLSCCHQFNDLEHAYTAEHQHLMEAYDSISDWKKGIPALLHGDPINPIRHTGRICLPQADIDAIQALTSKKWGDICQQFHLNPSDEFPLHYYVSWDNGLDFMMKFQAADPEERLVPILSFHNGLGDVKAEIQVDDICTLIGTHTKTMGHEIYEVAIDKEPTLKQEQAVPLEDLVPGYTVQWRTEVIESAVKGYAKYGPSHSWTPADAMAWALEKTAGGPVDLPYDLYQDMLLTIDNRCNDAKKTLRFRLQQIQSSAERESSEKRSAAERSFNR